MTMAVASTAVAGTHTITVTGSGGGITHTATVSLTVTAPTAGAFTISVSPTSGYLRQGTSGYAVITTAVSGGFDSAVALSASGQPAGVHRQLQPRLHRRAGFRHVRYDPDRVQDRRDRHLPDHDNGHRRRSYAYDNPHFRGRQQKVTLTSANERVAQVSPLRPGVVSS